MYTNIQGVYQMSYVCFTSSTTQRERTCLEKFLILLLILALVTIVVLSVLVSQPGIIYDGKSYS